jgi:hypothetical protein
MAPKPKTKQEIVAAAAAKYQIPTSVLWGVYGEETAHGTDVKTSSAGAAGGFQFLKSTAEAYDYPYTNDQSEQVFTEQADGAAHYLSDLHQQTGSWDSALQHYSGGGYGWEQVSSAENQTGLKDASFLSEEIIPFLEGPAGPGTHAENELDKATESLNPAHVVHSLEQDFDFFNTVGEWVTEPLRIVKLIGGGILVIMGLNSLTRGGIAAREAGNAKTVVGGTVKVSKRVSLHAGKIKAAAKAAAA